MRTSFSLLCQQTNTLIGYLREEQTVVDDLFLPPPPTKKKMKTCLKYLLLLVGMRCLVMRGLNLCSSAGSSFFFKRKKHVSPRKDLT